MKSNARVRWIVVIAPEGTSQSSDPHQPRRSHTADPFIRGLIAKLQAEVRAERRSRVTASEMVDIERWSLSETSEFAEAELTWQRGPLHFEEPDFEGWKRMSIPFGSRWDHLRQGGPSAFWDRSA